MERVPITELPRKQWTREECQALQDSGFVELEGYELIEGELVRKVSKSSRHIRALSLLIRVLTRIFGHTVIASTVDSGVRFGQPDEPSGAGCGGVAHPGGGSRRPAFG